VCHVRLKASLPLAILRGNDVVCVLWICVVVGTESYVCDQLPKLPEEPPPYRGLCQSWLPGETRLGFADANVLV
jgi:hypothetical protein